MAIRGRIFSQEGLQAARSSRHYKCREVIHMSDYEILMLIFTVIGLFLAFYKQGKDDK